MTNKQAFNEIKSKHFKTLEQYVPVVARVHGKDHPEFYDVKKIFEEIIQKAQKSKHEDPELNQEFKRLREITNNYTIPDDVCESYEAVYNMLAELDRAYQI